MLPALLKVMPNGKVHSLAVGGALLDFEWKDRQIVFLKANKLVRVRSLNLSPSVVLQNAEVVL